MSQDLTPLFSKGISKQFGIAYDAWPTVLPQIFHMGQMDGRYTDEQNWEMYGLPLRRGPGEGVAQGQFKPSFGKRYTPVNYALGDILAYEDWKDDQYGVMAKVLPTKGGQLAVSHQTLKEIVAANFFKNIAFATVGNNTPQMADGQPLFSTAHPISQANSGVTVSNRASSGGDLSFATYDAGAVNIRQQKAANNTQFLQNNPRVLVVNPVLHRVANQIMRGDWERGTADRNLNIYKNDADVIEWPYFQASGSTGTNNSWFIVADNHYLQFLIRQEAEITTDYAIGVQAYVFVSTSRFVCGSSDWRGCYGNAGA